jgi:hypothetical protein
MPRYRIFYAEHGEAGPDALSAAPEERFGFDPSENGDDAEDEEGEWEETYDANNPQGALSGFFADHAPDGNIALVEEDGNTSPAGGAFDPDRTYIWVEEDMLMEYQGIQEATPGTVACPLCDGTGEVDEATAEEYADQFGMQN